MNRCTLLLALAFATLDFGLWTLDFAPAHPVPRECHDRVITVKLTADAVIVEYHLEVDQWTVVFKDVPAILEKKEQFDRLVQSGKPSDWYEAFLKGYAPVLAGNLSATLDKQELEFTCIKSAYKVEDSVWCDFVFRAPWRPAAGQVGQFTFREGNYLQEAGRVKLSLTADSSVLIEEKSEPDEALKSRPALELRPGDDKRLRSAAATFRLTSGDKSSKVAVPTDSGGLRPPLASDTPHSLLDALLDSRHGFWTLLFLSVFLGGAHALTPGHGKTLVAAYLVGERGTVVHALYLGLVVTLTHTGSVLLLAAGRYFLFPDARPADVQTLFGFIGGLLVASLGVWLLLRRLARQPDHVHIGGHGHHHHDHHHPHHHHHDTAGINPAARQPQEGVVGWWGLTILGISGGIVPCTDALVLFIYAELTNRPWLPLPLLLAFSVGLAGVLVAIGIMVVYAKGFAASRWGESRLFAALPVLSAIIVTGLGLWLCYHSLNSGGEGH